MKKVILWIVGILVLLVVALILFVSTSYNKSYDAPYPEISATTDSAAIARGAYLVYGPAHCATCHVPMDKVMAVEGGERLPLSGGWEFDIPPAIVRAPNLTPDMETGIGKLTDGEIARALRYSVNHKNKFMMPFMPFQELSDEDLIAIISFLRSQEPVHHVVEPTEYTFLGKALLAFGAIKPMGPGNTPPKSVEIGESIEYGSYVANSIGNCVGCHTERDEKSGTLIGTPMAGGMIFRPDAFSQGYGFISPNLTPHKELGIMANWNEEQFIARFRKGRVYEGSHMPWGSFSRMTDTDLKAVYRYLASLEPVDNNIDKIVFAPGEEMPK